MRRLRRNVAHRCRRVDARIVAGLLLTFVVALAGSGCVKHRAPHVVDGVLDARTWDFERDGPIELSGTWEFAWRRLLVDEHAVRAPLDEQVVLPGVWNATRGADGTARPRAGYASYRATLLLPDIPLHIADHFADTSSTIYASAAGQEDAPVRVAGSGVVGTDGPACVEGTHATTGALPRSTSLVLVEQVCNFRYVEGGPGSSLVLGTQAQLEQQRSHRRDAEFFLVGLLVIVAFYHVMLWALRREERAPFWLALLCVVIAMRTLERGNHLQEVFTAPQAWPWMVRIAFSTAHAGPPLFCWYLHDALPGVLARRGVWLVSVAMFPLVALDYVTPPAVFAMSKEPWQLATVITIAWILGSLVRASVHDRVGTVRLVLVGFIVLGVTVINDILAAQRWIETPYVVGYGQAICVMSQAVVLALSNARARRTAEQLSERLLRADQVKNEFLATMSHELRTPLNAIINVPRGLLLQFSERDVVHCRTCDAVFESPDGGVLPRETPCASCGAPTLQMSRRLFAPDDAPALAAQLRSVERSGVHLLALVNKVLDHSKLAAERFELARETCAVADVVHRAVEQVQPLARDAGIELRPDVAPGLRVHADSLRIVQVLINLIANAVKFAPRGSAVDVIAAREGEEIVLRVIDRGIGIAPEHQRLIFEPFRQVDGSHTRRHGGTGLGLSIARQIVELHGGRLAVHSALGQGATFEVRLPAGDVEEARA